MIPNSIAVLNAKGGVGKTSTSGNLAGLAARAGLRTLLVDVDAQANLSRLLGYRRRVENDKGASLLKAVITPDDLPVPLQTRPNLRVITAGPDHTTELEDIITLRMGRDPDALLGLDTAIRRLLLHEPHDLVIFDCPPAVNSRLAQAAASAANFIVMPTKSDDASLDGFETFALQYQQLKNTVNPDLTVLGAFIFGLEQRRTRRHADLRTQLETGFEGTGITLFNTYIRHAQQAAEECLKFAELAHEYGENAHNRARDDSGNRREYSGSAVKLATDYYDLYNEVIAAVQQHNTQKTETANV